MSHLLQFRDISKSYPGVQALKDVSFGVPKGSVHGLIGENGAGKSTLIRILSGDAIASQGALVIDGAPQAFHSTRDAFAAKVAVVHQELQLVPELTVAENLRLGRFPGQAGVIGYKQLFEDVSAKLQSIGIETDPRTKVAKLSIGERQMIEIAKAVMIDARIIALDEPTSSLSSRESDILFKLIAQLRAEGRIILYVSHRMDEILQLCDGCTVLRDGRLAAHHETMAGVTRDQLVAEMVGRPISDIWGWRPRAIGASRLAVDGLTGAKLKHPASFDVKAGEILGFFGLIGAGRSELVRLIYGADPARAGQVTLDGTAVQLGNPRQSIKNGIVLCPEDRKFEGIVQGRSVGENITIASGRNYAPAGIINFKREAEVADSFIKRMRIRTPSRKQDIVNLSGGNQQKVILARWLSEREIKVLIVDEPTRGIDVGAKAEIYETLYELAEKGLAIIVVSSDLPEVMGISDRVFAMCDGRISAQFLRADFSEQKLLAAALPDKKLNPAAKVVQ